MNINVANIIECLIIKITVKDYLTTVVNIIWNVWTCARKHLNLLPLKELCIYSNEEVKYNSVTPVAVYNTH